MKKLLYLFVLLLFNFTLKAQFPLQQNIGNDSTLIRIGQTSKGAIRGSLIPSTYTDTTQANAGRIDDYPFAIIGTSSDGNVWQRNYLATGWNLLGGGVSPSGNFWATSGNLFPVLPTPYPKIGTLAPWGGDLGIITNSVARLVFSENGLFTTVSAGDSTLVRNTSGYVGTFPKMSLTTSGSSGAATYNTTTAVLNIPQYSGGSGSDNQPSLISLERNGVLSDADISEGSISFGTDQTALIQSIIDTLGNRVLLWDVKASVTGLTLYSYNKIEGMPGMGVILRNNSNAAVFQNNGKNFTTFADTSITINNLIINGNGYNASFPSGAQSHDVGGEWIIAVQMYGISGFNMNNCTIIRPRTFSTHFIKGENIVITNTNIDVGSSAPINCDGHHFNGPINNVIIDGGVLRTKDDAVGINADDILPPAAGGPNVYYSTAFGPISNVVVRNIRLDSCLFGIRLLSGASRVDDILISNITGQTQGYAVIIDNYWQDPSGINNPGDGNFGVIQVEDVHVDVSDFTTFGIKKSVINIEANAEKLIFKDIKRTYTFANSIPTIYVGTTTADIKSMVIDGLDVYDTSAFTTSHIYSVGYIRNLSVSRVNVSRRDSANNSILVQQTGTGSILNLNLNGVFADSINNILTTASVVTTKINAVNIIHNTVAGASFTTTNGGDLFLSNYKGPVKLSGTFTSTTGDAFGLTSVTPYAIVAGGTTATGNLQQVSGVGTSGQVLTSNGASALPTWQTSGSGVSSLSAIGATPNANGATISGSTLNLQPASTSFGGVVTTGNQSFLGIKTFTYADNAYLNGVTIQNITGGVNSLSGIEFRDHLGTVGGLVQFVPSTFSYAPLANTFILGSYGTTPVLFMANASGTGAAQDLRFLTKSDGSTDEMRILAGGRVGIQTDAPTAWLHLPAGLAAASGSPLKFTTGTSNTTAEAGAMEYTTPQLFFTNGRAVRQEIPQIQQSRVSTQYDNATTTLGNVTGLTANVAASGTYRFEAKLYTTSDVAGGIKVAIAGTATATAIIYEGLTTNAGTTTQSRATALATAVGAVTAVTAAYVTITGTITVNAAGTLTVQAAANAATGTTSVLVGSTFVLTEMN